MGTMSEAVSYERKSEGQRGVGMELIDQISIEKGATVLDLGCGTGYLTKVLSERVGPQGKVVAVDPDGERLKIAREKYSASNIEYIQADDKTFPPDQYDIIFCNTVIHWIHDKEALYKHVHNNLRPGGQFAFSTPDGSLPVPKIGQKLFDKLLGPNFLIWMLQEKEIYLSASDYEILASRTGLELSTLQTRNINMAWKSLDDYIDAMHGWFQGEFDPSQFDKDELEEFKIKYGDGPVVQEQPIVQLYIVLTKPLV